MLSNGKKLKSFLPRYRHTSSLIPIIVVVGGVRENVPKVDS